MDFRVTDEIGLQLELHAYSVTNSHTLYSAFLYYNFNVYLEIGKKPAILHPFVEAAETHVQNKERRSNRNTIPVVISEVLPAASSWFPP
jgi:hypothetical protein